LSFSAVAGLIISEAPTAAAAAEASQRADSRLCIRHRLLGDAGMKQHQCCNQSEGWTKEQIIQ